MSAGNTVKLVVVSEDKPLVELLTKLDITPSNQWDKGKPKKDDGEALWKNSGFSYTLTTKKTGEVEGKLKTLIEFLMPRKEQMLDLAQNASTVISIWYSGYKDEMWGIHLDAETVAAVAQLGLSIDIDLHAGGHDLE